MKVYGYCPYDDLATEQPLTDEALTIAPRTAIKTIRPGRKRKVKSKEKSDRLPVTMRQKANDQVKRSKAKNLVKMEQNQDDYRHGSWTGYCTGCRCDRCKEAAKEYRRARRARA